MEEEERQVSNALGASYHHVVVDGWPALRKLKGLDVPQSCTFDPGVIDTRFRGMAPGRLVPLLVVWLQELERRVAHLEEEGEMARRTTRRNMADEPRPPPGWFANWAPW